MVVVNINKQKYKVFNLNVKGTVKQVCLNVEKKFVAGWVQPVGSN